MKNLVAAITLIIISNFSATVFAQWKVNGKVVADSQPQAGALVSIGDRQTICSDNGSFEFEDLRAGNYAITVRATGFAAYEKMITINRDLKNYVIDLTPLRVEANLGEVVVSGTLRPVKRLESPVPVEVYTSAFLKKNPTPSVFEALQTINGVRPQLNCSICNTGDVHINGLEGPYTLMLIDGMPIVSALGSVYGLSGIPNGIIERIEVVKGPASSLYGSEAVGGLINIITKNPANASNFSIDAFATDWKQLNTDISLKWTTKKAAALTGINYFNFQDKRDVNRDGFTDVPLQNRLSVFQKWKVDRKDNRHLSIAGRLLYEDRWGGAMNWSRKFRGTDSVYGESVFTKRMELLAAYALPLRERINFNFSFILHDQNSAYGNTFYIANQKIIFGQLVWDKTMGRNDFLAGVALKYSYYDDNTRATAGADKTWLPGIFLQNEYAVSEKHKFLAGIRYDYNNHHGNIVTPRIAYKFSPDKSNLFRLNAGTGYRVVNIFTEDHAALTGAREVKILNDLKPERSYNVNLNYNKKINFSSGNFLLLDGSVFYTWFHNKIVPDYETDASKIIYDNLDQHAVSKGVSLNAELSLLSGLKMLAGATWMENTVTEKGITTQQMLTEKFSGTWTVSYRLPVVHLNADYTGNVYGPMRLPLVSEWEPRPGMSPWWSVQNLQLTFDKFYRTEIYGGVKNIFDFTPARSVPFLISRAHDPFDKNVVFDAGGKAMVTPENPYGLVFDPSYIYAPNQGRHFFIGFRYKL